MPYLEGQGDSVSRLIAPISHIVTRVIPLMNLLTKSPDPPGTTYMRPDRALRLGLPCRASYSLRVGPFNEVIGGYIGCHPYKKL